MEENNGIVAVKGLQGTVTHADSELIRDAALEHLAKRGKLDEEKHSKEMKMLDVQLEMLQHEKAHIDAKRSAELRHMEDIHNQKLNHLAEDQEIKLKRANMELFKPATTIRRRTRIAFNEVQEEISPIRKSILSVLRVYSEHYYFNGVIVKSTTIDRILKSYIETYIIKHELDNLNGIGKAVEALRSGMFELEEVIDLENRAYHFKLFVSHYYLFRCALLAASENDIEYDSERIYTFYNNWNDLYSNLRQGRQDSDSYEQLMAVAAEKFENLISPE